MTQEQKENKAIPKATLEMMREHARQAADKARAALKEADEYAAQVDNALFSHEVGIWPGDIVQWVDRGSYSARDIEVDGLDAQHRTWHGHYVDGGHCSGGTGGIKHIKLVKSC